VKWITEINVFYLAMTTRPAEEQQEHLTQLSQRRGSTSASAAAQTRCYPWLRLLRQICIANDYFNYSSQLETGRGLALNYLATSSARSTTGRDQIQLVGFINKSSWLHRWLLQFRRQPSTSGRVSTTPTTCFGKKTCREWATHLQQLLATHTH
jgi:hypothetical protein